jgi:hypothetical protein
MGDESVVSVSHGGRQEVEVHGPVFVVYFGRFVGHAVDSRGQVLDRQSVGQVWFDYFINHHRFSHRRLFPDGHIEFYFEGDGAGEIRILHERYRIYEALPGGLAAVDTHEGQLQRLLLLGYRHYGPNNRTQQVRTVAAPNDYAFERAVYDFQIDHGLDADGVVGPLTQAALRRAAGG